jgi:hypothetical protein
MSTTDGLDADDLVPLAKVADALQLRRQSLDDRLRTRGIVPVRRVVRGQVRVFLTRDQVLAVRQDLAGGELQGVQDATGRLQGASGRVQDALQGATGRPQDAHQVPHQVDAGRIRELEIENARLRGALETSDRVEQSAQRVADRLEKEVARLRDQLVEVQERARREVVSMAHELGKRDALVDDLRGKLALLDDLTAERERLRWWAGLGWFRPKG